MSNHFHLLVETPSANLSRGMQYLNGVYTQKFNRHHRRFGHVLQGRYKAILVEKQSHLLELARYVVLNPVRAGLARSAKDWSWSSYRATSGQGEVPEFLDVDWILSQFDAHREPAVRAYRKLVREGRGVEVWELLHAGCLLGTESFADAIRPALLEKPLDQNVLCRERDAARPTFDELFSGFADSVDRDRRIHEAVRLHHYKLREVAEYLDLHFSTISVIAKQQDARIRK